ncbi:MAG: hypothetical protein PHO54_04135 [Candidatus Peribacteraceae bacterium]|nr:hypothetical protein [Candidatus Peribacteraceae bacterium]
MEEINSTNGQTPLPSNPPEAPDAVHNVPPVPASPPATETQDSTTIGPPILIASVPSVVSPPIPVPPLSPSAPQLQEGIPTPSLPSAPPNPVLPAPKKRIGQFIGNGLRKALVLLHVIASWTRTRISTLFTRISTPPSPSAQPAIGQQESPLSLRTHWKSFALVFLLFTLVYLFIFRGVIWSIPSILRGDSVLNTSELVPIFDWHSQFLDQLIRDFSELTNGFEFRLRYSVLTTWMRYYTILPFAVVLAPLLFGYLSFLTVSLFLGKIDPDAKPRTLIRASALSVLLINLILLQAKITNFYTLVLGFDLFAIALVFLLCGIFSPKEHCPRSLLVASILILLNPAVHFLVLYVIALAFISCGALVFHFMKKGTDENFIPKRVVQAVIFTIFFALLPYALFVKFFVLHGVSNLNDVVPDAFKSIQDNSPSFFSQIALEVNSVTDNYIRGSYTSSVLRFSKAFYFFLAILPLVILSGKTADTDRRKKQVFAVLGGLLVFSLWCGLGYPKQSSVPTFHGTLAFLLNSFYALHISLADLGITAIATLIQILRFPDRFQFISLAVIMLLLPFGIISFEKLMLRVIPARIKNRFGTRLWAQTTLVLISAGIFFLPLVSLWEYRISMFSGDFGGFLKPYPVSGFRTIKESLDALPSGKTVTLPSAETARLVLDSAGTTHKFIDKFYIYYLNRPGFQYGNSGDIANKDVFFLVYQSLNDNQHWWINILRSLGIRYVVLNRELVPAPTGGPAYLTAIEQALNHQLPSMPGLFKKIVENKSFALYEFIDQQKASAPNLLIDLDWKSYTCLLENNLSLTKNFNFIHLNAPDLDLSKEKMQILTNDKEKTSLDLFARIHPESFSRPDQSSFAFNPDHIPSSQYFNTIFPMLNLLQPTKYNIMKIMMPGPFDTLTSTFVGLPTQTTIRFPVDIPEDGTYVVFLRGVFTKNSLAMQWGGSDDIKRTIDEKDTRTLYANAESFASGNPTYVNPSKYSQKDLEGLIPQKIMPVSNQFGFVRLGTI